MKSLLFLAFCFLSSLLFAQNASLPEVTIYTMDGKALSFKEAVKNDKITIVFFWENWCAPCKKELDGIAPVYGSWQKDFNVEMLAISIDDASSSAKIPGLIESKGWAYTFLFDKGKELMKALNVMAVPHTFLIQNEQIVWSHMGFPAKPEIEKKLKEVTGK